ncbi:carrier protein (macronuclear) [Tetrahymena thermophila SB210]|uniref:Carrier protein n=1 Tax=Tetrahymena thermophila (strain SB210) TaxID=312017 RepID=Q228X2_TETTS|nr:carrier protein [Tetrahymena thermophila SB210]EAR81837.2 carrier protein [Tetrahymena thermophila SB210]|eukprot:XP_001029500.2 carrier protein [Tetrahymena thermophila SB210]
MQVSQLASKQVSKFIYSPIYLFVNFQFFNLKQSIMKTFSSLKEQGKMKGKSPNIKERMQICKDLGIDYKQESQKYSWIIDEVQRAPLGEDWVKQIDNENNIIYFNVKEDTKQYSHPQIKNYRKTFLEYVANCDAERQTNQEKSIPKYLKRKDFINDAQAVTTNTKSGQLISSDYILPKENKQLSQLSLLLSRLTSIKQEEINFQNSQYNENNKNTLIELERELNNSYSFYEELLGSSIIQLPEEYQKPTQTNPYHIIRAFQILNINRKDIYLFFFGKLYCLLPLPPLWQRFYDPSTNQEYFYYSMSQIKFFVHPSYFYLQDQITYMKQHKFEIINNNPTYYKQFKVMKFQDQLMREFEIDLQELIDENETIETNADKKQNVQSKFQQLKKQKENEKIRQRYIKLKKIEEIQDKMQNDRQNYRIYQQELQLLQKELEKFDRENSFLDELNLSNNSENSISEANKQSKEPVKEKISDLVLTQLYQQIYLPQQFKFLIGAIEEFLTDKLKTDIWFYTINDEKKVRWVNKLNKRVIETYPHINELKLYIDKLKEYYENLYYEKKKDAKTYKENSLEDFKNFIAVEIIKKEASNFISYLISCKNENKVFESIDQIDYEFNLVYDALGLTQEDITKEQVMELLFFCPFNFEKDIKFNLQQQDQSSNKQGTYNLPFKKMLPKKANKNANQLDFREKRSIVDDILQEIKKASIINQQEIEQEKQNNEVAPEDSELLIKPTLKRANTISPTKKGSKENLQKQFIYQRKMKRNNTINKIQSPKTQKNSSKRNSEVETFLNNDEVFENTNQQRKKLSSILNISDEMNQSKQITGEDNQQNSILGKEEENSQQLIKDKKNNDSILNDADRFSRKNVGIKFQIELIPSLKRESSIRDNSKSLPSQPSQQEIKEKELVIQKFKSIVEEQEEQLSPKKKTILKDLRSKIKQLLDQERKKISAQILKYKQNKTVNISSNNISDLVSDQKKTLDSINIASKDDSFQYKKSFILNDNDQGDHVIKEALDQLEEYDRTEDYGPITKNRRIILKKEDFNISNLLNTTKDLESPVFKWKKMNLFQLNRQMVRKEKKIRRKVVIDNEYGLKPWTNQVQPTDNDIKIIKECLLLRAYLADESLNNIKIQNESFESDSSFSPVKQRKTVKKPKKNSKNSKKSELFKRVQSAENQFRQNNQNKQENKEKQANLKLLRQQLNSTNSNRKDKNLNYVQMIEKTYLKDCVQTLKQNKKFVKKDQFQKILEYDQSDYKTSYYNENSSDQENNPFNVKGSNENSLDLNFNYNALNDKDFFQSQKQRKFKNKKFQNYFVKHKNAFELILNEKKIAFDSSFENKFEDSILPTEQEELKAYQPLIYPAYIPQKIHYPQQIQPEITLQKQEKSLKVTLEKSIQTTPKSDSKVKFALPSYLIPKKDNVFVHVKDLEKYEVQSFKSVFKILSDITQRNIQQQNNEVNNFNNKSMSVSAFRNCFRNVRSTHLLGIENLNIQNQQQNQQIIKPDALNRSATLTKLPSNNQICLSSQKINNSRSQRSISLQQPKNLNLENIQKQAGNLSKSQEISKNCQLLCKYVILQTRQTDFCSQEEQLEYQKQFNYILNRLTLKIYLNYMDHLNEFIKTNQIKKSFKLQLFKEICIIYENYLENNPKNIKIYFKPQFQFQEAEKLTENSNNQKFQTIHSIGLKNFLKQTQEYNKNLKKLGIEPQHKNRLADDGQKIISTISKKNLSNLKFDIIKNISVNVQNFPKII